MALIRFNTRLEEWRLGNPLLDPFYNLRRDTYSEIQMITDKSELRRRLAEYTDSLETGDNVVSTLEVLSLRALIGYPRPPQKSEQRVTNVRFSLALSDIPIASLRVRQGPNLLIL